VDLFSESSSYQMLPGYKTQRMIQHCSYVLIMQLCPPSPHFVLTHESHPYSDSPSSGTREEDTF